MALRLLKKIDERTKLSVHGWIRNKEKTLTLSNIPSMINAICILYFRDDEIFNAINKDMKLSENQKKITKQDNDWNWKNCSFGIIEIESKSDMICQWDLNIKSRPTWYGGIIVGIASQQTLDADPCVKGEDDYRYCYANCGAKYTNGVKKAYGKEWSDCTLSIHLNLKLRQLSFSVNNVNQGIAFENIKKSENIKYRLMVSLFYKESFVEIINFYKQ